MIQIGDACPAFTLKDQHGNERTITSLLGKTKIVLFFYPKDDTTGCTKEACSFRDSHEDFLSLRCTVIGISSDSVSSHKAFAEKYQLNYILLADTEKKVRKLFGVPANLFGLIPGRVTYIIDLDGKVKGVFNSQTDPLGHIKHALDLVRSL